MFQFDRVCRITVGTGNVITIENLRIKFEIVKSIVSKENYCVVEIYNLSQETRNAILKQQSSIAKIACGYRDGQGLVEVGQGAISKVRTKKTQVDTITEIYFSDGLSIFKSGVISFNFTTNVKLKDVINTISSQTNVKFKTQNIDLNSICEGGYSDIGTIDVVLNNLTHVFNFRWCVQDGTILIKGDKASTTTSILLLSQESGFILTPENLGKDDYKVKNNKSTYDKSYLTNGYNITVLLQPSLKVGDVVKVKSEQLNGNFTVDKIKHIGDTMDNSWYSELEIK